MGGGGRPHRHLLPMNPPLALVTVLLFGRQINMDVLFSVASCVANRRLMSARDACSAVYRYASFLRRWWYTVQCQSIFVIVFLRLQLAFIGALRLCDCIIIRTMPVQLKY